MEPAKTSDKVRIRQEKLLLRRALDPLYRQEADRAIRKHLETLEEFRNARMIASYVSDGTEPDMMILLKRAIEDGREVCVPRWREKFEYEMAMMNGTYGLVTGKWNMPEADRSAPLADPGMLKHAFWFVPGVAFDERCCRLGRGKGIYDRLLSDRQGIAAGIFYECQKVPEIPLEPHDLPLDLIVTEAGIYRRKTQHDVGKMKKE